MTLPNGLYCIAKRPVSQGKTAFAAYSKRHARGTASRHYFCPATRLPPMACVPADYKSRKPIAIHSMPHSGDGLLPLHCRRFGPLARPRRGMGTPAWGLSSCSKLIAIKLCAISEMHAKVRRESVAGYATDETLVCGPKEHTRWWQRYRGHLQGLLYRLILNSYLLIRHNDCILQAFMPVALVCRRLCSLRREKARTGGMAMESMRMGKQQGQCHKRHWRIEARWQRNGACKRMHAQTSFATAHRPQGSQAGPSGCHPSHATAGRALTGGPDPMCKAGNEKGDDGIRCRHPQMSYSFKIILLRL